MAEELQVCAVWGQKGAEGHSWRKGGEEESSAKWKFGRIRGNSSSKFRVGKKIGDEDAENGNPEFARISKIQTKHLTRMQTQPSNAAEENHQVDKKIYEQTKLNCDELSYSDSNFIMEPSGSHKVPATPVKIKSDAELDRDFSEASDEFTELGDMMVEAGYERFGVAEVTELEVEAGHKMFGVAVLR